MSNSETRIILTTNIVAAAGQLLAGNISVTQFCKLCAQYGWTVSEINTAEKEIIFCFDTGRTDAFDIPIIQWQTLIVD